MSTEPDVLATAELLVPVLYDDLRRLARTARWKVSAGNTLQTTALVHEAYLRLQRSDGFADRQHFMRSAAIAMRQILVNLARDALADKRGGGAPEIALHDAPELPAPSAESLLEVADALERLGQFSERLAQVVECRFFGGYSDEETAAALGLTDRTVRRDWEKARAWLLRELGGHAAPAQDETA
jgi:RNA polymerase sigma factor (TIGR02999 family)